MFDERENIRNLETVITKNREKVRIQSEAQKENNYLQDLYATWKTSISLNFGIFLSRPGIPRKTRTRGFFVGT